MNIGSLFIALGFDVDDKKLKSFNEEIKGSIKEMTKMGAVAAATVYGISRFLSSSVQTATQLKNMREQYGLASDEMLRFNNVASRLNPEIDLNDTISMYKNLADAIADVREGGGASAEFARLGLSDVTRMSPNEILMQLRENYQSNSSSWQEDVVRRLMEKAGISASFMQAIKATPEEFQKLHRKAIPTVDQLASMERLARSYADLGFAYTNFKFALSEQIAPHFQKFVEFVEKKALPTILDFSQEMAPAISDVVSGINSLAEGFATLDSSLQTGIILTLGMLIKKLRFIVPAMFLLGQIGKATKMGGEHGFFGGLNKGFLGWEATLVKAEDGSTGAESRRMRALGLGLDWTDEDLGIVPKGTLSGQHKNVMNPNNLSEIDWGTVNDQMLQNSMLSKNNAMMNSIKQTTMHNNVTINAETDAEEIFRVFYDNLMDMQYKTEQDGIPRGANWKVY